MFPNGQEGSSSSGLEDRLRGLILNNANPATHTNAPLGPLESLQTPTANAKGHQQYPNETPFPSASKGSPKAPSQAQHHWRKRPNQAQRRQMRAESPIALDSRGISSPSSWEPVLPPATRAHGQDGAPQPRPDGGWPKRLLHHQNAAPSPFRAPQMSTSRRPHQHESRQRIPSFNQCDASDYHSAPKSNPQGRQISQTGTSNQVQRGAFVNTIEDAQVQSAYLEALVQEYVPRFEIDDFEIGQKEAFRAAVEKVCRECVAQYEQQDMGNKILDAGSVQLHCFGSMASTFAMKDSDMDLALVSPYSTLAPDSPESPIPRLLEKTLLTLGLGARLLTKTRVPIIKLCEKPTSRLHKDLLAERAKWESGFVDEGDVPPCPEPDSFAQDEESDVMDATPEPLSPRSVAESTKSKPRKLSKRGGTSTEEVEQQRRPLKQMENQPLMDYCNSAKGRLGRLGGRDLSANQELTEKEDQILTQVIKELIDGLFSTSLSHRLRNCQSIAPLYDSSQLFVRRSLSGICTQIEGESLVIAWNERLLPEASDRAEVACRGLVEVWNGLQQETATLAESNLYNKRLYTAAEKLKRISSVQLVILEQYPQEDPTRYLSRTQRLMSDLRQTEAVSITPIFVAQYIKGIRNRSIQEELSEPHRSRTTLSWVGFQHRVLQLAADYEHALLRTKLYEDCDKPAIEDYIGLLHQSFIHPPNHLPPSSIDPTHLPLISRIRSLPDPTNVSPNRPRDRFKNHLNFPPDSGIQCDINFSAHLALHNTLLLRCYSHCDVRVRPFVLFIKYWAKTRCINAPYRGTLSSYGYVLMVLHYLVNIVHPFVCPNLQVLGREPPAYLPPAEVEAMSTCQGRDVKFWRNEAEIKDLCARGFLNQNQESIGALVRGFFEYYAQNGPMGQRGKRGFDWGREVISLRTVGGILSKQDKGWVGARTVVETTRMAAPPTSSMTIHPQAEIRSAESEVEAGEGLETPSNSDRDRQQQQQPPKRSKTIEETKEVRYRYLFAIEDPFELDHNVARTVTHNGIVRMREELRRGWRIIRAASRGPGTQGYAHGHGHGLESRDNAREREQETEGLLDAFVEEDGAATGRDAGGWSELMNLMHGDAGLDTGVSPAIGSAMHHV